MFVQALRELDTRTRGIREMRLEVARLRIEEDREFFHAKHYPECDEKECPGCDRHDLSAINCAKLALEREYLERTLRETEREADAFLRQARHLRKLLEPLTPERIEFLERDYWYNDVKRRMALDLSVPPFTLSQKTRLSLICLPRPARVRLLMKLHDDDLRDGLMKWLHEFDDAEHIEAKDEDKRRLEAC
jgi:hypothetical protein